MQGGSVLTLKTSGQRLAATLLGLPPAILEFEV